MIDPIAAASAREAEAAGHTRSMALRAGSTFTIPWNLRTHFPRPWMARGLIVLMAMVSGSMPSPPYPRSYSGSGSGLPESVTSASRTSLPSSALNFVLESRSALRVPATARFSPWKSPSSSNWRSPSLGNLASSSIREESSAMRMKSSDGIATPAFSAWRHPSTTARR